MGNTGVGKTQTAESLAQELNIPIIKFNMGEYKTKESVSDFVGNLRNYVINNYTGVVLFDELEKADSEVLDAILSFTDKDQIGSGGESVTSKSQIVFMTSNMMISKINECAEVLKEDGIMEIPEKLIRQLIEHEEQLKPEFLGRIDSVICYNILSKENSKEIFLKLISEKIRTYQENNIIFNFSTDKSLERLCDRVYEDIGGVRALASNIDSFFSHIMSNLNVLSSIKAKDSIGGKANTSGNVIDLDYDGSEIKLKVNGNPISISTNKKIEEKQKLKHQ